MKSKTFEFNSEGKEIFTYKWAPEKNLEPKAVLQITHGMVEHARRYEEFARHLTNSRYIVYANDHRGHGKTADSKEKLGHLADQEGWNLLVKDMKKLTEIIKENHKTKRCFLFGHSMGSLLARDYISRYGREIDGVILSGTSGDPGPLVKVGQIIAKVQMFFKGKRMKSDFLNNLLFDEYNREFSPNRTDFDWLSRDDEEVDRYIEDPFCGQVPSTKFFYDLFEGIEKIHKKETIEKTPKNLPIWIFSGEEDPVGEKTEGVMEVYEMYRDAGFDDVSCQLYKNGRHEMLHELNKKQVFKDVTKWLDNHL